MPIDIHRIPLDAAILIEPILGFKKVQRLNKGLKTNYIPAILFAGDFDGCRCRDWANYRQCIGSTAYRHFQLCVKYGYLVKRGIYYYLTDTGAKVRKDTLRVMKPHLQRVKRYIINSAKAEMLADTKIDAVKASAA